MPKILIADDEKNIRNGLAQALGESYEVLTAADGHEALQLITNHEIDAAIVDLRMPKVSGSAVLKKALTQWPALAIIILTGHGSINDAVQAMRDGAYDFLTKPVDLDHLSVVLKRALEHHDLFIQNRDLSMQNNSLKNELEQLKSVTSITAKSRSMQKVLQMVNRVAQTDITVLISGESGVGKELIADAIHASSARHAKPFIKVHCAALFRDTVRE